MIRIQTLALAFAPAALSLTALPAAAQDADRMAAVVEAQAESGAFMGAVMVAGDEGVLLERAWGSANLEWDVANTTDTKFRIGSVTKQFTAVAIMMLHEQNLIDLDAPVSTYLDDTPETWASITVRQMIRHTAGLPNVTSLEGFDDLSKLDTTQDELIASFKDLPLEFEPGSAWKYSNSGYVLLSRIVEKVGGSDIDTFFKSKFFEPLGMTSTGFDVSATILPKRAAGYSPSENGPRERGLCLHGHPHRRGRNVFDRGRSA